VDTVRAWVRIWQDVDGHADREGGDTGEVDRGLEGWALGKKEGRRGVGMQTSAGKERRGPLCVRRRAGQEDEASSLIALDLPSVSLPLSLFLLLSLFLSLFLSPVLLGPNLSPVPATPYEVALAWTPRRLLDHCLPPYALSWLCIFDSRWRTYKSAFRNGCTDVDGWTDGLCTQGHTQTNKQTRTAFFFFSFPAPSRHRKIRFPTCTHVHTNITTSATRTRTPHHHTSHTRTHIPQTHCTTHSTHDTAHTASYIKHTPSIPNRKLHREDTQHPTKPERKHYDRSAHISSLPVLFICIM